MRVDSHASEFRALLHGRRAGEQGLDWRPRHQRGAAVLMALFVAALATMIITGLFYRQFVLLRTIENQQLTSQSRLLLRGALDWGRAILREDALRSQYDALSEPWSQPLAETRLDQLGETGSLAALATIAGSMEDAQGRFNLRNLVENGQVLERELQALQRLVSLLQLPEQTADLIALRMAQAMPTPTATDPSGRVTDAELRERDKPRPLPLMLPQDLAGIAGVDPAAVQKLAPYIVVLDERTPLNTNTAAPETIAARVPELTLAEARALVAERDRLAYFNNVAEVRTRLGAKGALVTDSEISTASRFFFIRGEVKLDRAITRMEALVKRAIPGQGQPAVTVLWTREI
ncbi:MAG TPA: type II secretion system minor pseudopilin GspK [Burkholderiaceae bacterium]|nr:type II secretion system minor pseudopilin GspK [Burkholderiaceae bacterium]